MDICPHACFTYSDIYMHNEKLLCFNVCSVYDPNKPHRVARRIMLATSYCYLRTVAVLYHIMLVFILLPYQAHEQMYTARMKPAGTWAVTFTFTRKGKISHTTYLYNETAQLV